MCVVLPPAACSGAAVESAEGLVCNVLQPVEAQAASRGETLHVDSTRVLPSQYLLPLKCGH